MILIKYLFYILFSSFIIGQSQYQILGLADNALQISSNNGFSGLANFNSTSNPASLLYSKNQSYSFIYYPANIKFANFRINNFSVSILNYGTLEDKLDNISNNTFSANEYLFKYSYNKKFKNKLRFGISVGGYYSQIYKYNSYGIISTIGINKFFDNINLGIGFSLENIGSILKNYTNTDVLLPSRYSLNLVYKYKQIMLGWKLIDYLNITNTEYIMSLQFEINENIFLNLGTSSNRRNLAINNEYKYLYGMSCGIGFKIKNIEVHLGIKNLGISGNIFGVTVNNLF